MSSVLVFDIETIPDVVGLRKLYDLPDGLDDEAVAEVAFHQRRQQTGGDFLPLHQHRVCAIACAFRDRDQFKIWSVGAPDDTEATLVQRFFEGIEKYTPTLVSWNGNGFDLPVLHYRAMVHGVVAAKYWDFGEDDRDFKWNNYISRYHTRHLDLMDLLALYQPRAYAPLDQMAHLCGFPGKLGMDGSQVWGAWCRGGIVRIRDYCETDVMNTYLVYLRFQMMRGHMTPTQYEQELALARQSITAENKPHWQEFLQAWAVQ